MTWVAYNSGKQKSYRLNRPLDNETNSKHTESKNKSINKMKKKNYINKNTEVFELVED